MRRLDAIENRQEATLMLVAASAAASVRTSRPHSLDEVEFKVFSQGGEDGIIQFLTSRIPIPNRTFVEFGVSDYTESNTRYLLFKDNWKGLILDGSEKNIRTIRESSMFWRYELTAAKHFITKDNINAIIGGAGFAGDVGLLSIDIDGNDYWVWKEISVISPRIVVCEYNSVFGPNAPISIPYKADFLREAAHHSHLYYGASLPAFFHLAGELGYSFVGSDSGGHNAFFVRNDLAHGIPLPTVHAGYVRSTARESRDRNGVLSFVSGDDRVKLIEGEPVVDVITNAVTTVGDALRAYRGDGARVRTSTRNATRRPRRK
jgi:hypothetical protein